MPTVADLRDELRNHGLPTTGLKATLQQRLDEHQASASGGSAPSLQPSSPAAPSLPSSPSEPDVPTLRLGENRPGSARKETPSSLIGLMHRRKDLQRVTLEESSRLEQLRQFNEKMYKERQKSIGSPRKEVGNKITRYKLIKMFEDVDIDGNGTLDRDEVRQVLCKIKDSETVDDAQLTLVMNDLNISGTGEVTQAEFLDYFERTRESGAGIIGKYFAKNIQKESPTLCTRIRRRARDWTNWILNRAILPFKAFAGAATVLIYWKLVTDQAFEDHIVWMMMLPLSCINVNSSIDKVRRGYTEMRDSLENCKGDAFRSSSVRGTDVLQELKTHAELFLARSECFDEAFQHSMSVSQSAGVLSVPAVGSGDLAVLPSLAFSGLGVVECSVLIAVLQVFLFFTFVRSIEHLCAAAYATVVGNELWNTLREAHFEVSCKTKFDELDVDHDGTVTRTELKAALQRSHSTPVSEEELDDIIAHADANGNDTLEYEEFRVVWYKCLGSEVLPELKKAFTAFDRDENGFASITEFRDVMQQLPEPYTCEPSDEDLQYMTDLADVDMDGQIDYDEFVKMMLAFPSKKKPWYSPIVRSLKWLHPNVQTCKWGVLSLWILLSVTPPIMWLEKLIGICSEFEQESTNIADGLNVLLRNLIDSRNTSDFSCEYQTFGFKIAALVKWVVVDLYEGLSGVGIFGAICGLPTAYEMWNQRQAKLAEDREQQQKDALTLERNFMEVVQFSLCRMNEQNVFSYTTMFEMNLKDLVKGNKSVLEAVHRAAEKTTKQHALLHTLGKHDWQQVRGMILNTLSEKYSDGYVAEDLGIGARKAKFWFCLTNEQAGGTTKKMRVIVVQDKMLKIVQRHLQNGTEPRFEERHFKPRWTTVKHMATLLEERAHWKNSPMRDIVLALPFHMDELPHSVGV
jgi:Ca2+-binding EF-hand superfamily protein